MRFFRLAVAVILFLLFCGQLINAQTTAAQTPTQPATPATAAAATTAAPQTSAANPSDVATIDAIVAALYDVISGPAGKTRDWNRLRSLFAPGARLIPTGARPTGEVASRVLSVDDFIAQAQPAMEKSGFFEREIARRTEQYGHIAHLFSTYESRHEAADAKPFQRGINSIQLMNDGKRWWVVTIFWEGETERNLLPAKYLSSAGQ